MRNAAFPLSPLFDLDVIVSPVDIHYCEFSASAEVVYDLGNEGGHISVLFCPFVNGSIVLHWS